MWQECEVPSKKLSCWNLTYFIVQFFTELINVKGGQVDTTTGSEILESHKEEILNSALFEPFINKGGNNCFVRQYKAGKANQTE